MSNYQEISIEIRGLQTLLRKCLNNNQLELIDFTATRLLPLGENYSSLMVKLNATIRRSEEEKNETLHLVGKMMNHTDKPIVDWPAMFKKELFVYAELMPAYKRLQKKVGVKDALDIFPKFIGYRCSLGDTKDIVDEHSMLLMENLKIRGYYTGDKEVGFNLEHSKKALSSLAKYHALGIALKKKYPKFMKKVLVYAKIFGGDIPKIDEGFDSVISTFRKNATLTKHLPVIEASFAAAKKGKLWRSPDNEPWVTVTHGDFWVNNILFHKDENGIIDDVKFVDFQMYFYGSALRDVVHFLIVNLDEPTKANHVDELLELYHRVLIRSLQNLGCDIEPFDKESFDRELKLMAIKSLPISTLAVKFFHFDITEKHKSSTILADILESQPSDLFVKKLQDIVRFYETKGWF